MAKATEIKLLQCLNESEIKVREASLIIGESADPNCIQRSIGSNIWE